MNIDLLLKYNRIFLVNPDEPLRVWSSDLGEFKPTYSYADTYNSIFSDHIITIPETYVPNVNTKLTDSIIQYQVAVYSLIQMGEIKPTIELTQDEFNEKFEESKSNQDWIYKYFLERDKFEILDPKPIIKE